MSEIDITKCKHRHFDPKTNKPICTHHNVSCNGNKKCYYRQLHRYKQVVKDIKRYCRHNRQAGWVDIEGIFEIIQECEDMDVNN